MKRGAPSVTDVGLVSVRDNIMTEKSSPMDTVETERRWLAGVLQTFQWSGMQLAAIWKVVDMPASHWVENGSELVAFSNDGVSSEGRYGAGSYFAIGDGVGGKHLQRLQQQGNVQKVNVSGNILMVNGMHSDDATVLIAEAAGCQYGGDIQKLVRDKLPEWDYKIGTEEIDGFLIMDEELHNGELVVFRPQGKVVIENSVLG